ncbi:MAG: hypothetical protein NTW19_13400 [Planctomycetota bacterium]|nr:hypothetical protein [Planctomycetota bacterium]
MLKDPRLRRFWIEVERGRPRSLPFWAFGVTAHDYADALAILQERVFKDCGLPEVVRVVANVDVRELDQNHVVPNMGVVVWRGVWHPKGFD